MAEITNVKINSNVKEVTDAVRAQLKVAMESVGQTAEGYAKKNCPVDTGLLRNSITYALGGQKPAVMSAHADKAKGGKQSVVFNTGKAPDDKDDEFSVYVGSNVEYASSIEFRDISHKSGKAHFLRDAVTTHNKKYKSIIEAALSALN